MAKEINLLSRGIFEKPFMDSKAKTRTVSRKEVILGHVIGPLGLILVVNTIAALVEKFFTQQTGAIYGVGNVEMIQFMGRRYEFVMTARQAVSGGYGTGERLAHPTHTIKAGQNAAVVPDRWFFLHYHRLPHFPVPGAEWLG